LLPWRTASAPRSFPRSAPRSSRRSNRDMIADVVRQRIRDRIQSGSLPRDRTIELWHAFGFGQTCDGCGVAITTTEWMCLMCADDWRRFVCTRTARPLGGRATLPDSWFDLASRPASAPPTPPAASYARVRSHAVPVSRSWANVPSRHGPPERGATQKEGRPDDPVCDSKP
jgi:hypothetical protein